MPRGQTLTDVLLEQLCAARAASGVALLPRVRSTVPMDLVIHSPEMRYTMSGRAHAMRVTSNVSKCASDRFAFVDDDDDDEVMAAKRRQKHTDYATSNNDSSDVYDYCSAREDAEANAPLLGLRNALGGSPSSSSSSSHRAAFGTSPSSRSSNNGTAVLTASVAPIAASLSPSSSSAAETAAAAATVDRDATPQQQQHHQQQPQHHHQHKRKRCRPSTASRIAIAAISSTIPAAGYSSDDNASRGALDLIIPPPKDFAGRNNPFLIQPVVRSSLTGAGVCIVPPTKGRPRGKGRGTVGGGANKSTATTIASMGGDPTGTAAAAGTTVRIVRTIKRRLSAKDLVIGPNMEVKRRKIRRSGDRNVVEVISTATIRQIAVQPKPMRTDFRDLSLSHRSQSQDRAAAPAEDDADDSGSSPLYRPEEQPYGSIAGRQLRKRMDTNYAENGRRSSATAAAAAAAAAVVAAAAAAKTSGSSCSSNSSGVTSIRPMSSVSSTFSVLSSSSASSSRSSFSSTSSGFNRGAAQMLDRDEDGQVQSVDVAAAATAGTAAAAPATLNDLQSSLTAYFGAVNRIANGERFTIRGKRIGLDGRQQYLIEWET